MGGYTGKPLSGKISDQLRGKLAKGELDDRAVNPGRPASPTRAAKLPDHVQGEKLGGRPGRKSSR
jgi:hypothetical protein